MTPQPIFPDHPARTEQGAPVAANNIYPYRVGLIGGLRSGVSMALVMAGWGIFSGGSIWTPVNLIAATLLPHLHTAPLAQFDLAGVLVGTSLHLTISTFLGLLFAIILPTLPGRVMLWALIVAPLLWVGTFLILPLFNPLLAANLPLLPFVAAHLVYSIVLGLSIDRADKLAPRD